MENKKTKTMIIQTSRPCIMRDESPHCLTEPLQSLPETSSSYFWFLKLFIFYLVGPKGSNTSLGQMLIMFLGDEHAVRKSLKVSGIRSPFPRDICMNAYCNFHLQIIRIYRKPGFSSAESCLQSRWFSCWGWYWFAIDSSSMGIVDSAQSKIN